MESKRPLNPIPAHVSNGQTFTETVKSVSFPMVYVEGNAFDMGADDLDDIDGPVHRVTVNSFFIGAFPVTQRLWEVVMESNPSFFPGPNRPVESISWEDCQGFLQKLNAATLRNYRLPTEAEWEFAARGGKIGHKKNQQYAGSDRLTEVGWFEGNSHGETKAVGLKFPNELGLYDMTGNVWEWVEDQWHDGYDGAPLDGSAWVDREHGANRVHRGGSWGLAPPVTPLAKLPRCKFATTTPRGIGKASGDLLACAWSCPSSQEVVNPCYPVSQRSS